ncbi:MAG: hypothetical protein ACK5N9_15310, partial [Pirellula sp.]
QRLAAKSSKAHTQYSGSISQQGVQKKSDFGWLLFLKHTVSYCVRTPGNFPQFPNENRQWKAKKSSAVSVLG